MSSVDAAVVMVTDDGDGRERWRRADAVSCHEVSVQLVGRLLHSSAVPHHFCPARRPVLYTG